MSYQAGTDEQWRQEMSPEKYAVLRQAGTSGVHRRIHRHRDHGRLPLQACEVTLF